MAHQIDIKFPSLFDSLYCEEEEWEEEEEPFTVKESLFTNNKNPFPKLLLEHNLLWENDELSTLFDKEKDFNFCNGNLEMMMINPLMVDARSEAVEWMLKVTAYYSFSAVTALLAVSYLDRFLFGISSNSEKKPWMTQLAAVACLSLAAKVEETDVPLLLDFQVEESKYVFEAKTIQRMEILVLSTLQWKMHIVTPLSFVDYVTRRLDFENSSCWDFIRRCECFLLSIISDCRFICYLPSVMAAAAMLHVFSNGELCLGLEYQEQLLEILGIDKDKVEECYRLMSEVASRNYHLYSFNKRPSFNGSAATLPSSLSSPESPKGVMDISFSYSSDSSNDSWAVAAAETSVSSSPEPLLKRARVEFGQDDDKVLEFNLPMD